MVCGVKDASAVANRPNVLVIVADDFGYGDLGIHGCQDIPTPHLDALGVGGVRCTHGYVSAPQCSPTRAGLLTGRYQQRFGHESNMAWPDSSLPVSETTLADRLRQAGYVTGMVGKWHLGSDEQHHPLSRGFQEFFGFLGGANPYLPQRNGVVPRIVRGREPVQEKEFLTEAFAREAAAFIDRHGEEPFFLYLAFNAPHGPLEAAPKYLQRFEAIEDEKRRTYAAMVSAMDDAVGTVMEKLRAKGLEENTLVFFLSDNGGPTDVNASRNTPFRGVKGEVREGGIRSPFFIQWKARLPTNKHYDRPVIQLDIAPTVLAAVGAPAPPEGALDGVNLLPYLEGKQSGEPHQSLYWRFNFPARQSDRYKWAIRQGDWKLFTDIDGNRRQKAVGGGTGKVILVNLAEDPTESQDRSTEHPEKVAELRTAWNAWNTRMAAPGELRQP